MNVLSLFDGMSCGQQALERSGHTIDNYFASEVDKYAIQVTQHNYPKTKQLGDVRFIDPESMPIIQLLIGGSPCQSFSFAGKRKGMSTKDNIEILTLEHYLELKEQNFEFEGQSYLFWEYVRILTALRKKNPDIKFLLENVMMGEKWQKILTQAIGINPIEINSTLVSAQNRRRLYWTNIGAEADGLFNDLVCKIPQPKDKGILLKDILENDVDQKYFLSKKSLEALEALEAWETRNKSNGNGFKMELRNGEEKSAVLSTGSQKSSSTYIKIDKKGNIKDNQEKASCFTAGGNSGGNHSDMDLICVAMRGRDPKDPSNRKKGLNTEQRIEPRDDGKTNTITSVQKDNLIMSGTLRTHNDGKGFRPIKTGKGATIPARAREDGSGQNCVSINNIIRRLTPIECERLQTVKDNYTSIVSDTQRYRMLGNGWTVDVIAHIFSYL